MAQPQELAQTFIDALHALEKSDENAVEGIAQLFSDDAELLNSALKLAGKTHSGAEGVRAFWTEYRRSFSEIYSEFAQVTTNDTAAGLFWTAKGSLSDGDSVEYDGVSLLVFDESGKIASFRGYYDTRELTRTVTATQDAAE